MSCSKFRQKNMLTDQMMLDWIESATYEQLLQKWRFEPIGSPWFADTAVSDAFSAKFIKLRDEISDEERIGASKRVGWNNASTN